MMHRVPRFDPHRMTHPRAATPALVLALLLALVTVGPVSAGRRTDPGSSPTPTPTATTTPAPTPTPTATATPTPTPTPTVTPSPSSSGYPVQYSDSYWEQLALIPSGWASNACEAQLIMSGTTGVCTTEFAPVYLYPDGTWGDCPWYADPTVPSGWSVEECQDPTFEGF